jgi:hypothetical protein
MQKIEQFLSDMEVAKLRTVAEDDTLRQALHKLLLSVVYTQGVMKQGEKHDPLKNFLLVPVARDRVGITNEALGADLRSIWQAINMIEGGFNELDNFKSVEKPKDKKNEAR